MTNQPKPYSFLRGVFFFSLGGFLAALVLVPLLAAVAGIFPTVTAVWGTLCGIVVTVGIIGRWYSR